MMNSINNPVQDKPAASIDESTVEERMQALIEYLSAYIEQYHGGSVKFVSFDGKKVQVRLGGACETCQLQSGTLQGWIKGTVSQFFPEVEVVEGVD